VACAAALATLDLIEQELMANAAEVGAFLLDGLHRIESGTEIIIEVRGLGLMIGVEFPSADVADAVEEACFQRGLLVLRAGDSAIRISPPLVVSREQTETGLRIFQEACADVAP
jgi:4-aminobutyrate aminotransferase